MELVAEDQVLKSQVPPGSKQRYEAADEQFEPPAGYPLAASSSLGFLLDSDLPPYTYARPLHSSVDPQRHGFGPAVQAPFPVETFEMGTNGSYAHAEFDSDPLVGPTTAD
jgi:hypothetical protein